MNTPKHHDLVILVNGKATATMPINPAAVDDAKKVAIAISNELFTEAKRMGGWTLANKMHGSPTYSLDLAAHHIIMTITCAIFNAQRNGINEADELLKRGWTAARELAHGLGNAAPELVEMFENLGVLQLR